MNPQLVERFYRQHNDRLVASVNARIRGRALAEDAAAQTWAILLQKPDTFELREDTAFAWLATVAYREALAKVKHDGAFLPDSTAVLDQLEARAEDHDTRDQARHILRELRNSREKTSGAHVGGLSRNEARALVLRMLGYSYEESTELLGCSYTAINRRVTEGRKRLRAELDA